MMMKHVVLQEAESTAFPEKGEQFKSWHFYPNQNWDTRSFLVAGETSGMCASFTVASCLPRATCRKLSQANCVSFMSLPQHPSKTVTVLETDKAPAPIFRMFMVLVNCGWALNSMNTCFHATLPHIQELCVQPRCFNVLIVAGEKTFLLLNSQNEVTQSPEH